MLLLINQQRFECTSCGFVLDSSKDKTIVAIEATAENPVGLGDDPLGVEEPVKAPLVNPLFEIRECEECGKNEWEAIANEQPNEPDKQEGSTRPRDKGFQDTKPPAPEVRPEDPLTTGIIPENPSKKTPG